MDSNAGSNDKIKIGIMTSGGDAQGMNAAVRAVVRTALHFGAEVYCIHEGYEGLQFPEKHVKKMGYKDVSGILGAGGTILGTARCEAMKTHSGKLKAVHSLLTRGIDRLVCIGGDGSLRGANFLCNFWNAPHEDCVGFDEQGKEIIETFDKGLVEQLIDGVEITKKDENGNDIVSKLKLEADALNKHPQLYVVGLPGTIDNDMVGSDITIGADTALHRITEAVDAIFSTADSHQRTFVVEVMGRHCGYLALMAGLATGAEWVLIPENPCPKDWEDQMVRDLQGGKDSGKRASIVIVAEGARGWLKYDEKTGPAKDDDKLILDEAGRPTHKQGQISSEYVKNVLSHKFGADTRVTILGHVQRGGIPSSYDRNLATMLGIEAAKIVIGKKEPVFSEGNVRDGKSESVLIGMHNNRIRAVNLADFVRETNLAQEAAKDTNSNYDKPFEGREHLKKIYRLFQIINSNGNEDRLKSLEEKERVIKRVAKDKQKNIAILHCGAVAPGMNMAVRTVVRMAVAAGHRAFCVEGGIEGLINGTLKEYKWMDVTGWAGLGGAKINTGRENPTLSVEKIMSISEKVKSIRDNLKKNNINALVMIGGLVGYEIIASLSKPVLGINIPMICIPASIDNNLPGSDFSIGVDTALNNIVNCVDKIKRSQTVSRRCFLIEVMGNKCGYLALMSGLASGAEHVYINEVSKKTEDFLKDIELLKYEFKNSSRRVGLIINNENANSYTTEELERMFEIESEDIYDVRKAILGHIQQGGDPSPFDRTFAARISEYAMDWLCNEVFKAMDEKREYDEDDHVFVGFAEGKYKRYGIHRYANMVNNQLHRPVLQWWEELIRLNDDLSERLEEE